MDWILSARSALGRDFCLGRAGTFARCSFPARISGLRRSLEERANTREVGAPGSGPSPEALSGTSARRDSILYKPEVSSVAQLFVACPELRPGRGNSLTTRDTYEVLRARRAVRTAVAAPNRDKSQ